jgi:hypothetical protein
MNLCYRRYNPSRASVARVVAAVALLVAVASPALPLAACAAEPAQAEPMKPKVEVELMVVHATNAHDRVDERLRPVLQHLRFLQYKGFTLLSAEEKQISVGSGHTFSVAGSRKVTIDVVERDELQVKLRVRMLNERGVFLDSTIRIHRNKSFMVGGPDHDGGKLLLPLRMLFGCVVFTAIGLIDRVSGGPFGQNLVAPL